METTKKENEMFFDSPQKESKEDRRKRKKKRKKNVKNHMRPVSERSKRENTMKNYESYLFLFVFGNEKKVRIDGIDEIV